jgi:ankyrin repeat protein
MWRKSYLLFIPGLFIAHAVGQPDDLVQATRRGDTAKIEEILKSGTSVNTHDSDGRTALHEAAATENLELFKLLVAAGADIRARDNKGETPESIVLHTRNNFALWAAMARSSPQRPTPQDGPWTLTSAISHRQPGVVEMLLKLGVNPNAVDANGDYPLDLAAQKGDSQIVQSLLSRGAAVNFRNKTGSFPIHTAALNGYTEVVKLLLDQAAEIDCQVSETGETPPFYAASFGRTKTVELLLARGANKNIANKDGITPLAAARKADQQDTANLLR